MNIFENKKILIIGSDNKETITELFYFFKKIKNNTDQKNLYNINQTQIWSTNSIKTTNIELVYFVDYYIFTSNDALPWNDKNILTTHYGLYLVYDVKKKEYFYVLK